MTGTRHGTGGREALILASASPRRIELLKALGVQFTAVPAHLDEKAIEDEMRGRSTVEIARWLAEAKADTVAGQHPGSVVVAADTVVSLDGISLGKPESAEEAYGMLTRLNGRGHDVITAVAVAGSGSLRSGAVVTPVLMRESSSDELRAYAFSPEPLDKAGAYAVQGAGGRLVKAVGGCFLTVVGFPVCLFVELVAGLGINLGTPAEVCTALAATMPPPSSVATDPHSPVGQTTEAGRVTPVFPPRTG